MITSTRITESGGRLRLGGRRNAAPRSGTNGTTTPGGVIHGLLGKMTCCSKLSGGGDGKSLTKKQPSMSSPAVVVEPVAVLEVLEALGVDDVKCETIASAIALSDVVPLAEVLTLAKAASLSGVALIKLKAKLTVSNLHFV